MTPATATMNPAHEPGTITNRQIRRLFAIGRRRGLGVDGLRELTPEGSISRLSYAQAEALAARLSAGLRSRDAGDRRQRRTSREKPAPPGVVRLRTPRQVELIEHLRLRCGFSAADVDFVCRRAVSVDGLANLANRDDARKVINVLHAIAVKQEQPTG